MMNGKKPKQDKAGVAVGVAWYLAEDWERLREISADKDALETTHAKWLKTAEGSMAELQRQGIHISRVIVRPEPLLAWCQSRSRPVDSKSRAEYAAEESRRRNAGDNQDLFPRA